MGVIGRMSEVVVGWDGVRRGAPVCFGARHRGALVQGEKGCMGRVRGFLGLEGESVDVVVKNSVIVLICLYFLWFLHHIKWVKAGFFAYYGWRRAYENFFSLGAFGFVAVCRDLGGGVFAAKMGNAVSAAFIF